MVFLAVCVWSRRCSPGVNGQVRTQNIVNLLKMLVAKNTRWCYCVLELREHSRQSYLKRCLTTGMHATPRVSQWCLIHTPQWWFHVETGSSIYYPVPQTGTRNRFVLGVVICRNDGFLCLITITVSHIPVWRESYNMLLANLTLTHLVKRE